MNPFRQAVLDRVWQGRDPILQHPVNLIASDLQGWNSQHPYLAEAIAKLAPAITVEVGVWKGGSTVFMADRIRQAGQTGLVIAVDTWLGSSEHWLVPEFNKLMGFMNGYPALYHTFIANLISAGVQDHVIPLPLDSLNAAQLLRKLAIAPGLIHIDAGHDLASVTADLNAWWPLLQPGGQLIGDDYCTDGRWPEVRQAFDTFFGARGLTPLEHDQEKCRVLKPTA